MVKIYQIFTFVLYLCLAAGTFAEFLVNVRTEAGNIVKESITENIDESYVVLAYEDWDLTRVRQLVDFKSSLYIFRIILYGEIELSQPAAHTLCFVSHFAAADFIEPDAVSKLRQKNQDAIRTSENQLERIYATADLAVNVDDSDILSVHIQKLCRESNGPIFTTENDISKISKDNGIDYDTLMGATRRLTAISFPKCNNTHTPSEQCTCQYQFNIDWYPCSLRYCKSVVGNRPTTYKCGIRTCSLIRSYQFPVENRSKCWWMTQIN